MSRPSFRRFLWHGGGYEPGLPNEVADARQKMVDFLVRIGEEVWRLEKRLDRAANTGGEEPLKGIRDSLARLQDALAMYEVLIEDHQGQPYREGLRVSVLHVDGQAGSDDSLWIAETITPTVLLGTQVLSPGQVVLANHPPARTT